MEGQAAEASPGSPSTLARPHQGGGDVAGRAFVALLLVVLAPAAARAQGAWEAREAGGVSAQVYVPAGPAPGAGRPLLLVLHGCSQSAATLRDEGGFEATAEEHQVVVALPQVPGGGVYLGCWDYYGAGHDRESGHAGQVLALVDALLADEALGIDPARVAVAGLSSGGGMALVLGCLAPDVFSGVAAAAGPAPGTGVTEIQVVSTSADRAGDVCRALAGASAPSFARQRAVLVTGTADAIVAQGYAPLEAEMFTALYADAAGQALASARLDVSALEGSSPRGEGTVWSDAASPRVALLVVDGMGHAWPAGSGPDGGCESDFVTCAGPNLAAFLADFFEPGARPPDADAGDDDAGPDPASGLSCSSCSAAGPRPRDAALAALAALALLALRRLRYNRPS